jgi:hypothetical protein
MVDICIEQGEPSMGLLLVNKNLKHVVNKTYELADNDAVELSCADAYKSWTKAWNNKVSVDCCRQSLGCLLISFFCSNVSQQSELEVQDTISI